MAHREVLKDSIKILKILLIFSICRFLVFLCVLLSGIETFGRELRCTYSTYPYYTLWPKFRLCALSAVDLSTGHNSEALLFTDTELEKSEATVVWFSFGVSTIDLIPKEILKEFPNLNGLGFTTYKSPVIKNNVFTEDFQVVEYLYLGYNRINTIEANALEHLSKLKWFGLQNNQIHTFPFQLFKKNPELIYIGFFDNKVASINPNLFDGLNKIKLLDFEQNVCINEELGCETCSIAQSGLKANLSSCFSNCQSDPFCSAQINV